MCLAPGLSDDATMSEFDTIRWSFNDETGIGRIVLDRPDALNSLSTRLKQEIVSGFERFKDLDNDAEGIAVRVVMVEGAGDKAFCAGADVTEFGSSNPGVFQMIEALEICEQYGAPVVAKIDGYCFGGGLELALSCDFRIASERSILGQTESDFGSMPGGGGTQRLAQMVGPSRAKELIMMGRRIEASQAETEGIVDYVYPAADLEQEALAFATELADRPPLAVRAIKDVVNHSQETGLTEGRKYEHRATGTLRFTDDFEEGATAFAEDREPEWQGK